MNDDEDPFDSIQRTAEREEMTVEEVMRDSISDNLYHDLRTIGSRLGVNPPTPTKDELLDSLVDAGLFYGPIGDNTFYVREGGESYPLEEYLTDD